MPIFEYQFNLTSCQWINPQVKYFAGQILHPHWNFLPGQFVTIHFEHEQQVFKRSYSIANPPQQQQVEFAASYVEGGPGSQYLFSRQAGDTLRISGPYGRLVLKPLQAYQRLILIATSTGITPYRSMMEQLTKLLSENPQFQLAIIQGVQKTEHVLFAEDFQKLCQQFPQQANFAVALSRETPLSQSFFTIHGHVQDVLAQLQPSAEHDLVYLCGNPQMIDDVTHDLLSHQFQIQQIVREKYISK